MFKAPRCLHSPPLIPVLIEIANLFDVSRDGDKPGSPAFGLITRFDYLKSTKCKKIQCNGLDFDEKPYKVAVGPENSD